MADSYETTNELYLANVLTEEDVRAAVDAFMADPTTSLFTFGNGYRIDLAKAVAASNFATLVVKDGHADGKQKRVAVRTAILSAAPERP